MKCPSCEKSTNNTKECDKCNINIKLYNQVHMMAGRLYNKGLEQAKGRSLSGAIESLNMCIRLQKNHIDANNLLGLVYFEIGEIGSAISCWLKSLSYQKENNKAQYYLEQMETSASELRKHSDTIMLYNKSLEYFVQKSEDMAVISLRKASSQNPNYIKAKELLSLYYICNGEDEKARELLEEVLKVSKDQPKANYYLSLINIDLEDTTKHIERPKIESATLNRVKPIKAKDASTIIEPNPFKGNIIAFIIGAICMFAVYAMLINPSKTANLKEEIKLANEKGIELQSKLDKMEKEQKDKIAKLEEEKSQLEKDNESLKEDQEAQQSSLIMREARELYEKREWVEAADTLSKVKKEYLDFDMQEEYQELVDSIYPRAAEDLYNKGYREHQRRDYESAIELLEKSYFYEKEGRYSDNALYMIGRSYEALDDMEKAKQYYNTVIENYPDTNGAYNAKRRL